ncbi:MAG: hypothetical protein D6756_13605 [Cyanobacteria bacterium J083]|nr:MAG: hypothetical protein D6756_13605 [Cyanobacteria bacterium J083]
MSKVLIIVNAEVNEVGKIIAASPATERMIAAIQSAIPASASQTIQTEVIAPANLWAKTNTMAASDTIYCPLTIQLPDNFIFPGKEVFAACKNIKERRHWVESNLNYQVSSGNSGLGDLWLPIVLTEKGPLYGEVIGEGAIPNSYEQPIDLPDAQRKPLYRLAYNVLESISALPAVYLLQFSLREKEIVFDRLWPFPAAPALASMGVQEPNLYTCHWHCLMGEPVFDMAIAPA